MTPKISVIIPVYNVSEYLDKCLWSITNQTFRDIEIIVVNDGSTDSSLSVIERYAAQDNRIKIINKQNEGLSMARKSGLEIATGNYIHHCDGDDYLELNTYELLYNKAIETNSDMVFMNFFTNDTPDKTIIEKSVLDKIEFLQFSWENCKFFSLCQNIHKRELTQNIHFDRNLIVFEDAYHNAQLAYQTDKIIYLDKHLYHYVMRKTSITNCKFSDKKAESYFLFPQLIKTFFEDTKEYKELEKYIFSLYVNSDAQLYWFRYFKNAHQRSKISISYIKKYPEIAHFKNIKGYVKLIRLYAINTILGRIFAQYYILKKKIN